MLRVTCSNCHLPFILNREALQAALDEVHSEGFKHYNAYCSNCGRQNKVSKKQLRRSAPWWKPGAAPAKQAAKKGVPAKRRDTPAKSKATSGVKTKPGAKGKAPAKAKAPAKSKTKAKAKAKKKAPAKSKRKSPAKKSK